MSSLSYSRTTLSYALTVIGLGLIAGGSLLLRADTSRWHPGPLIVLGGFSLATTLLTITVQGFRRSKGSLSVSSATIYALIFLVDPSAVALVITAMVLADWLGNRRSVLPGLFNVGQSLIALWVAVAAWSALGPASGALEPSLQAMLAGAVAVGFYTLINHLLTAGVLVLASGVSLRATGVLGTTTLFNEIVIICFGLSLGYLWNLSPPLILLGLIPPLLFFTVLGILHHREEMLEARRDELASIQQLGLQIGAKLDVEQLGPAVVRIAAEALHSPGALLATLSEDGDDLELLACRHPARGFEPPARLPRRGFTPGFFDGREPLVVHDAREVPEVAYLGARSLLAVPLRCLGQPGGVLVVFDQGTRRPFGDEDACRLLDLSRFVEMALTNARLYTDLKAVQEQLIQTEKLSALGQLISGVAHELNNPLTGVRGFAEILQQTRLDTHQHRMVERIEKEADRAARVVRNLLTFSRRHKPEKGLHDLNGILNTVLEMRSYECRVSNVELTADLDPDLPRTMVDAHQLHQVFLNLLTNAEHAVAESGRPGRIVLRSLRDGERIRIEVTDNGPGIDPAIATRIFNPFFTTKEVGRGTGLGLSICYGIVQEHGGIIEVDGRPGQGACFAVLLPVLQAPASAPVSEPLVPEGRIEARPGERVLVVDDELSVREIVREALEPLGFRVDAAVGGAEALTRLQSESYDLILSDLRMPGLGGRELYERVLRSDPGQAGRFVFLTGDVARSDTGRFLADTGRPVLAKPFGIDELLQAVAAGLSRSPSPSTLDVAEKIS